MKEFEKEHNEHNIYNTIYTCNLSKVDDIYIECQNDFGDGDVRVKIYVVWKNDEIIEYHKTLKKAKEKALSLIND